MIIVFLAFCRGEQFDRSLVHSIESIIIDWSHQIQNVLKRDSAQPLLEGTNPGPIVELDFWKARAENLECIFEQVGKSYCYESLLPTFFHKIIALVGIFLKDEESSREAHSTFIAIESFIVHDCIEFNLGHSIALLVVFIIGKVLFSYHFCHA